MYIVETGTVQRPARDGPKTLSGRSGPKALPGRSEDPPGAECPAAPQGQTLFCNKYKQLVPVK